MNGTLVPQGLGATPRVEGACAARPSLRCTLGTMSQRVDLDALSRGKRAARIGILTNTLLAALKLVGGAHTLGGAVTRAIHGRLPQVQSVIVHMEPYERTTA